MPRSFLTTRLQASLLALGFLLLSACASGPDQLKPLDLGPNPALLGVRQVWSSQLGVVDFPLQPKAVGKIVTLASSAGKVTALDARSGVQIWTVEVGAPISAGVGFDGRFAAVVSRANELVVVEDGKVSWRSRVGAQVLTAPLVAGERIFVLGADRSLAAYDAKTGRKLWLTQRPGDPLVLRQAGVLTAVSNTLIVGSSGHLLGVDPQNGNVVWDAAVSTPRGTNDIERLVDLVGGFARSSDVLCVRSFLSNVSCVDTKRGAMLWKKAAIGSLGLSGDSENIYGVEDGGRLIAWRLSDGEQRWLADGLRYRQLSAPLTLGRSVIVGDENGLVHLLSRTDGSALTRLNTDGSAISVTPVDVGGTLVVVTRKGGVFGFQPE
jgi:outer membrane protein assembly factor BamB